MRALLAERVPFRVLLGDKDPYVPASYAHSCSRAHVTNLPEAGHGVLLVAPDQTLCLMDRQNHQTQGGALLFSVIKPACPHTYPQKT
jgi:pimeloyl-ACP methyl ester carboxylesterase